jgi:DNA-binding response OmpR family regulator
VSDEPPRPRVLVVDDNALLLRSLTRVLARAGFDVVGHETIAAAAAALRADRTIAVVLTDLRIGTTTGLDLIALAGTLESRPGVVVLSGVATPDDVAAALAAGAAAVIKKPAQPAELVAAVLAAVRTPGAAT